MTWRTGDVAWRREARIRVSSPSAIAQRDDRVLATTRALAAFIDLAIVFSWSNFDPANPLTWILVAGLVFLLVAGSALVFAVDRRQVPRQASG